MLSTDLRNPTPTRHVIKGDPAGRPYHFHIRIVNCRGNPPWLPNIRADTGVRPYILFILSGVSCAAVNEVEGRLINISRLR